MADLNTLSALGFALPTPAYLFGLILFGLIGLAAYGYGRKTARPKLRWTGLGMMLYPYAISDTWLLYAVGAALCTGLYWMHD